VSQVLTKKSKGPRCGDTKVPLLGIKHMKNSAHKNAKKRTRTVSRAYGGTLSGNAVKARIMRAFLVEEQKAVKKLLAAK